MTLDQIEVAFKLWLGEKLGGHATPEILEENWQHFKAGLSQNT